MSLYDGATTVEQWIHDTRWLLFEAEQYVDASLSKCPYESNAELGRARETARLVARALTTLNTKVASLRTAIEVQLQEQDSSVSAPRACAGGGNNGSRSFLTGALASPKR
jgi:hypothetical protein